MALVANELFRSKLGKVVIYIVCKRAFGLHKCSVLVHERNAGTELSVSMLLLQHSEFFSPMQVASGLFHSSIR